MTGGVPGSSGYPCSIGATVRRRRRSVSYGATPVRWRKTAIAPAILSGEPDMPGARGFARRCLRSHACLGDRGGRGKSLPGRE